MIDQEDADDFAWLALLSWPEGGIVFGILALVVWGCLQYAACSNAQECEGKACAAGEHAELLRGECLCVAGEGAR